MNLHYTTQFKKDYKRIKKQNKDLTKLRAVVVKRIDYDSFGNVINDTNPAFKIPFGFAGGLHDRDIGLVRNINLMPAVKFFVRLDLEPICLFLVAP